MFAQDPLLGAPEEVRRAFVACMRRVIKVDGVLDGAEDAVLDVLARQLDVPRDAEGPLETLQPVADHVVVQAAWLAACDGEIAVAEREVVEALEVELDATPGIAARALAWAARGMAWFEEGRGLVAGLPSHDQGQAHDQ